MFMSNDTSHTMFVSYDASTRICMSSTYDMSPKNVVVEDGRLCFVSCDYDRTDDNTSHVSQTILCSWHATGR